MQDYSFSGAQGGAEYLLIIGAAVVVSAIVIGVILMLGSAGQSTDPEVSEEILTELGYLTGCSDYDEDGFEFGGKCTGPESERDCYDDPDDGMFALPNIVLPSETDAASLPGYPYPDPCADGIDNDCDGMTDLDDGDDCCTNPDGDIAFTEPGCPNGPDCAPDDGSKWRLVTVYVDGDCDDHGSSDTEEVCLGNEAPPDPLPPGSTCYAWDSDDCDDGNPLTWEIQPGYLDEDSDGFGYGAQSNFCTGPLAPGYSANDLDCDDNPSNGAYARPDISDENVEAIRALGLDSNTGIDYSTYSGTPCDDGLDNDCSDGTDYGDEDDCCTNEDGDSYYLESQCPGNADCDDTNAELYRLLLGHIDFDEDTYGDENDPGGGLICSGVSLPQGYSTNWSDCDDSDDSIWQWLDLWEDSDQDTYGFTDEYLGEICVGDPILPHRYEGLDASDRAGDCCDSPPQYGCPSGAGAPASVHVGNQGEKTDEFGVVHEDWCSDGIDNDCDSTPGTTDYADDLDDDCCADDDGDGDTACTFGGSCLDCDDNNADIRCAPDGTCDGDYGETGDGFIDHEAYVSSQQYSPSADCDDSDGSLQLWMQGYPDADCDGYGEEGSPLEQVCTDGTLPTAPGTCPGAYSLDDTDCEDGNPYQYPGSGEIYCDCDPGNGEVEPEDNYDACGDGLDNDCDGLVDCEEVACQGITFDCISGLVGHWKFEEGSGSTTADISGNGNTGTITTWDGINLKGVSWVQNGRKSGQYTLRFHKSDCEPYPGPCYGWVQTPVNSFSFGNNSRTITLWMRDEGSGFMWQGICGYGEYEGGKQPFALGKPVNPDTGNTELFLFADPNNAYLGYPLSSYEWFFVAVRYDSSTGLTTLKMKNDSTDASNTVPRQEIFNTTYNPNFFIGAGVRWQYEDYRSFKGQLDEVMVWNEALSDSQIDIVYNYAR